MKLLHFTEKVGCEEYLVIADDNETKAFKTYRREGFELAGEFDLSLKIGREYLPAGREFIMRKLYP